jgi:hypothetical protein
MEVNRYASNGLDCIGVNWNTARCGLSRELLDWLDGSCLIVRKHQGREPCICLERHGHFRSIYKTLAIDCQSIYGKTSGF